MSNEMGSKARKVVCLWVLTFKGVLIREAGFFEIYLSITRIRLSRVLLLVEHGLSMHNRREVKVVTEDEVTPSAPVVLIKIEREPPGPGAGPMPNETRSLHCSPCAISSWIMIPPFDYYVA